MSVLVVAPAREHSVFGCDIAEEKCRRGRLRAVMSRLQYIRMKRPAACAERSRGKRDEIILYRLRCVARQHECGRAIDEPRHNAAIVGINIGDKPVGRKYFQPRALSEVNNLSAHGDYFL